MHIEFIGNVQQQQIEIDGWKQWEQKNSLEEIKNNEKMKERIKKITQKSHNKKKKQHDEVPDEWFSYCHSIFMTIIVIFNLSMNIFLLLLLWIMKDVILTFGLIKVFHQFQFHVKLQRSLLLI